MKICPSCRRTYTDDGLNFCLDDGTVLTLSAGDPPETVLMNQPRATSPNPTVPSSWDQPGKHSMQPPRKSSKTWIWVVGILGVLVLLCGGGFVAFLAYIGYQIETANSNRKDNRPSPPPPVNRGNTATPSPPPFDTAKVQSVGLSGWVQENSPYGNTEYTGDELVMSSKEKGFYYVLVAQREYITDGAATRVTVRNIDDADSTMGYGLVFHSNPQPLEQAYAFLIDSKKRRYRVVRHVADDEPIVVKWTDSSVIKDGTEENILEARDSAGKVDLYINDELVTSIKNTHGYKDGVPGLYSGDGVKAAFSKLEIRK